MRMCLLRLTRAVQDLLRVLFKLQASGIELHHHITFLHDRPFGNDFQNRGAAAAQATAASVATAAPAAARTHLAAQLGVPRTLDRSLLDDDKIVSTLRDRGSQELGRVVTPATTEHPPAGKREHGDDRYRASGKGERVSRTTTQTALAGRG